ncbi:MAG: serine--tRNA ligase, partial [Gemmatimonadota bacterium]
MLDIRTLRSDPDAVLARLAPRGDPSLPERVRSALAEDEERRRLIAEVEELKARRNAASREIGDRKRRGEDTSEQIAAMQEVASRIRDLDAHLAEVEERLRGILLRIPNLPDPRVPPGARGEGEVVRTWGEPRCDGSLAHWEVGGAHGVPAGDGARFPGGDVPLLDLERGAKVAGSGFPLLLGPAARLSRALIQFMLDLHVREHGYLEIAPPYLVNRDAMTGTGHLPKFEEDAYRTDPDDLFLVPTAEVPLTSLHRDEMLAAADLPLAYV